MTRSSSPVHKRDSVPADPSAQPTAAAAYEAPAIVYRGKLELRAGSPLAINPLDDPDNPFK